MATLLQEVRAVRGAGGPLHAAVLPLGEPRAAATLVERKMLLDGVEWDGTTFKDWVGCYGRCGRRGCGSSSASS